MPWVEKYRPKGISDIASQKETVKTLNSAVKSGNLPHLLFYGPPGTGKTSMALALCRNLWGPELFKSRVLEMNASDERGISIVRNKVKYFANLAISHTKKDDKTNNNNNNEKETYPCPPFKLIILDEADTMTPDAQSALRRVIEAHSRITRFCLICNYVTRIIEPLASRCAKFRFKPLPLEDMIARLRLIAGAEGVVIDQVSMNRILELSEGDLRKAVTTLQAVFNITGCSKDNTRKIVLADVEEMSGNVPDHALDSLVASFSSNKVDVVKLSLENLLAEGYPALQILKTLSVRLIKMNEETELSGINKAQICVKIANVNKRLIDGADEFLQLLDVCCLILRGVMDTKRK